MKHSDNETLPPNDLALQAFERGAVSLALDILTTGTGRSKEDALLLLHRSAASVVGPEAKRMRPRDVALPKGLFQFVGVFDKAEAEAAAALIVLALQVHSPDEWSTVTSHQVADLLRERHEALISSLRNPFWLPRPALLVDAGWVDFETNSDDGTARWTPTDAFVERLSGSRYDLRADLP